MAGPKASEEEQQIKRNVISNVRIKRPRLRRAINASKMDAALQVVVEITSELNNVETQLLSPRSYYELYLTVIEELCAFETFLVSRSRGESSLLDMYEKVQHTEQVTPRLYLLITVGSALITTQQTPVDEVTKDLLNMCSAVQNPVRGLFLRTYLAQSMKDKLPGSDSVDGSLDSPNDKTLESLLFILHNFTEMNRLWVRMQHDCPPQLRGVRKKQRKELSLLIGSNIMALSKYKVVDEKIYKQIILPQLLEQIVSCREPLAQEYLAECVVQVFPDEYHLQTLDELLAACAKLQPGVDIRLVMGALTDRLRRYASSADENRESMCAAGIFEIFRDRLPAVVATFAPCVPTVEFLMMFMSLLKLVLVAYPDRMDYVDEVLRFCINALKEFMVQTVSSIGALESSDEGPADDEDISVDVDVPGVQPPVHEAAGRSEAADGDILREGSDEENVLVQLISVIFEAHQDISKRLQLSNFLAFSTILSPNTRRSVAAMLLESIREYKRCISSREVLEKLFTYVSPLIEDLSSTQPTSVQHPYFSTIACRLAMERVPVKIANPSSRSTALSSPSVDAHDNSAPTQEAVHGNPEEVLDQSAEHEAGPMLVSKVVYLLDESDPDRLFEFHRICFEKFVAAGTRSMDLTLPALIFSSLRLAARVRSTEALEQALEIIGALEGTHPERALQFHLDAATVAYKLGEDASSIVRLSLQRAIELLDTSVVNSRTQLKVLTLVIHAVITVGPGLVASAYENVCQSIVSASSRLLTRSDQCRALCDATTLFWHEGAQRDSRGAKECLQLAYDSAMAILSGFERVLLLCDIFVRSIYLFESGCTSIDSDHVARLTSNIHSLLQKQGNAARVKTARARLLRSETYVRENPDVFSALRLHG